MKIYTNEEIKLKKEKKQRLLIILRRIFYPIISIIIIFCAYIAYQRLIKKEQNIELFGYKTYIVLTGSMEPNINIGDVVVVKKTQASNVKVGDVITFQLDGQDSTVTHRVVEKLEDENEVIFRTKGDNNNAQDPDNVKPENIQGVMLFKVSKLGKILTKLLTGTGFIAMIIITIISYEHSNKKEDRKLAREEARKRFNVCKYKKDEENKQ